LITGLGIAEGSFARRHKTAQAALKAAKQIVDAARASDVPLEAQSWLTADGTVRVGWQGL
jgi:hypothetical protein